MVIYRRNARYLKRYYGDIHLPSLPHALGYWAPEKKHAGKNMRDNILRSNSTDIRAFSESALRGTVGSIARHFIIV